MRALKTLVIVMAVLIVAGLAVLVVAIVNRAGTDRSAAGSPPGPSVPIAGATTTQPFQNDVALPAGSQVVESRLDGDRLMLRLRLADGTGRIMIVELGSGRIVGTVTLR